MRVERRLGGTVHGRTRHHPRLHRLFAKETIVSRGVWTGGRATRRCKVAARPVRVCVRSGSFAAAAPDDRMCRLTGPHRRPRYRRGADGSEKEVGAGPGVAAPSRAKVRYRPVAMLEVTVPAGCRRQQERSGCRPWGYHSRCQTHLHLGRRQRLHQQS